MARSLTNKNIKSRLARLERKLPKPKAGHYVCPFPIPEGAPMPTDEEIEAGFRELDEMTDEKWEAMYCGPREG